MFIPIDMYEIPAGGNKDLTEECFQQTPLRFSGDDQWIQVGDDVSTRQVFPAMRTTSGTWPRGSQWTRNPVPNCAGMDGGYYQREPNSCPKGLQFEPPVPGLFGQVMVTQTTIHTQGVTVITG